MILKSLIISFDHYLVIRLKSVPATIKANNPHLTCIYHYKTKIFQVYRYQATLNCTKYTK